MTLSEVIYTLESKPKLKNKQQKNQKALELGTWHSITLASSTHINFFRGHILSFFDCRILEKELLNCRVGVVFKYNNTKFCSKIFVALTLPLATNTVN